MRGKERLGHTIRRGGNRGRFTCLELQRGQVVIGIKRNREYREYYKSEIS